MLGEVVAMSEGMNAGLGELWVGDVFGQHE